MKKAFIVILLTALLAGTVSAQTERDFTFVDNPTGVTITGYTGTATGIMIPAFIGNKRVTRIGSRAFMGKGLTAVHNQASFLTVIEDYAFAENQITSINFHAGLTTIETHAFYRNRLESVTFPDSLTTIGDAAFYQNRLTRVDIPRNVTTIGQSAFENNIRMTTVNIGNSVVSIGMRAFAGNENIATVNLGNSIQTIGESAFNAAYPMTSLTIPSSVTSIGPAAFGDYQGNTVTIGANVQLGSIAIGAGNRGFVEYYNAQGRRAGVYTWNPTSRTWSRR